MSAFWIFAVALTVAYIIYYCVIIAKDLAKPREQVSSDEETFELADTAPEPSKVVAMTDKGFQVQDGFGNVREQEITGVPAPLLLSVLGLLVAQVASAKSGGVDYSWGAGALAKAHDYTVTMMLYVLYVCYAVGSVMAIISALLIYFKMQYHEGEVMKNIMTLIGAVLFIIGASIVFPDTFTFKLDQALADNGGIFLVIEATEGQSNGVSRAHSKASGIKLVEEPTAAAIDIRADYVAKNGAPSAAAPKIFFRYYYVNSSTGEKSGVMLAETTWTAAAAGGEP